jgi:branched-chain amino acid transport system ATP-binding protein
VVRPFPALSVEDNVLVGAMLRRRDPASARRHAHDVLTRLELFGKRHQPASTLTLPDRKRLEVARALATDPRLLLLDEVMAGLRPAETDRMVSILSELNRDFGLTILLIEHVMRAVMALAARVLVLHHGAAISEGAPDAVVRDPAVVSGALRDDIVGTLGRVVGVKRGPQQVVRALDDVSLEIDEGAIVAIVGANGAGKTSLIRTIAGMLRPARGRIAFRDTDITGWESYRVCNLGIGQVAEGRQVFPTLSVAENLDMGAMLPRARGAQTANLQRVFGLFPVLAERLAQPAGTLSGGEQQMLAIGRCLMGAPELVMFDEPSLGLAPAVVQQLLRTIRDLNGEGLTCVLVEQNVAVSLKLAARAYVLENGRITLSGPGEALLADDRVRRAYLGL